MIALQHCACTLLSVSISVLVLCHQLVDVAEAAVLCVEERQMQVGKGVQRS